MVSTMICLAAMTLGVDVGWEPSDQGLEYIIQIEPEMLDSLRDAKVLRSDVPPQLRGELRTWRIQVGTTPLPKEDLPARPPAEAPPTAPPDASKTASSPGTPPSATKAKEVPAALPVAENARHIAAPADYEEPSPVKQTPGTSAPAARSEDDRTALAIVSATAVGLLAALVYLSWIHLGMRSRYRALLAEHVAARPAG